MRKVYLYKDRLWEEIHNFKYTGDFEKFDLAKGDYFVLCDGARCSANSTSYSYRPYGGRAMGILNLKKDSTFYAAVGGDGGVATSATDTGAGGWNGGGAGGVGYSSYKGGYGGGGASDIRLSNDMSLGNNGNLCTTNRVRVRLNTNRSTTGSGNNYFQLSEWTFYDENDNRIPISNVSASTSDTEMVTPYSPSGEGIANLVDMSTSTKTALRRDNTYSSFVNIYFEFSGVYTVKSYNYTTANDYDGRDPISWRVYSMNDNDEWVLVDKRIRETITTSRKTQTQLFTKQKITHEDKLFPDVILPGEYEQVRYIRAINNDSAIVLDYYPTDISDVEFIGVSEPTYRSNKWECLFGTRYGSGSSMYCFGVCWEQNETAVYLIGDKEISKGKFLYNELVRVRTNGSNVSWYNGKNLDKLVNTIETTESRPASSSYQLCVMGSSSGSVPNSALSASGKCYGFKIFENNELIRNYVPAVRYDGRIGLCCTITGKFHEVASSSYFKTDLDYRTKEVPIPISLYSRIIVGGGAGGPGMINNKLRIDNIEFIGSGGGAVGTVPGGATTSNNYATESYGYAFGIGEQPVARNGSLYGSEGVGGGGGGWFGGYSDAKVGDYSSGAGGGGSSYVFTEYSWTPEDYTPDENYYFTDAFMDAGVADVAQIIVAKEISILKRDDEIYSFCTGRMEKLPINSKLKLDMECYGAAGGARFDMSMGGTGGYARGTVNVVPADELYVTVGGNGFGHNLGSASYRQLLHPTLSFNGGGYGGVHAKMYHAASPGGGATDIRICPKPLKQPIVSEINYIKVLFYERRVEYKFGADGYVGTPWFQLKYLYFYHGNERIDISEIYAYADEDGLKTVTYDSAEKETTENVSKLLTGDNMFACKWENVVNVTMKTSETIGSIDKYAMFAPSDAAVRNPAAWRVYVSENGIDWSMIDNRFNIDDSLVGNEYVVTKEEFELHDKPTHHNRILVAGGGGGQGRYDDTTAGKGGGETGSSPTNNSAHQNMGGGTQRESQYNTAYGKFGCDGVFGHGGQGNKYSDSVGMPGGGGGWFGGAGTYYNNSSADNARSGAGGSGYVLTENSWKPPCYSIGSDYYLEDTSLIQGGNTLSKPQSMVKMRVVDSSPVLILAGDKNGTKYFNTDEDKWVVLKATQPTIEDFEEYGIRYIPNDNGLENYYDIYAISTIDEPDPSVISIPSAMIYNVTPAKLKIHHTGQTSMRVRKLSADIEYDKLATDIDISATKVGVGPTAHLDIDVFINKQTPNTVEKLYSIYMEAGLDTTGNRYIPPKIDDPEADNKPLPRPGDDDYIKKYLLQVGARNNIPRNFEQFQFKYNDITLSEVIETCSKIYDREIYSMMRLKFGSTYINRLTKYNTITKKTTLIKDFTQSIFDANGVGDFVRIGNKFIFVAGYNIGYYNWYVYNMDTDTLTNINANSDNYYTDAFGKIYQLNEQEVVFKGRYGMIIYNLIRNTYSVSSGLSQYARDFCVGNKYYLVTYDSTTVHFVDRISMAVTSMSLPLNTQTVCTFSNGKFFVAQNGYLHIIDENTKTIERSIVVPWSSCRSISYQGGVVYVTVNNSSRLWVYHLADQRYDSTILPWNLTFDTNGHVMRGVMYNNSWWIAHWTMGNVSYIGDAKYNFGQKYGQYQIAFNADTVDQLEYDDRFVTKEETHLLIHDGDLTYDGSELEGADQRIRKFSISKKDYNIYKYNSFDTDTVDKINEEEESETQ